MYIVLKRIFDCIAAGLLLAVLSPLFLIVAVAIRVTMGRPVFFRQMRAGFNEKLFTCIKFRTMNTACDELGRLLPDEQRLTWLGRLLRRTSIDELPQLWSICRGDLSLIGPRPLLVRYLPYYSQEERRRHSVRPGLTGWAQVHGRNTVPFEQRLEMDVWYVDHMSWILDLQILFRTVWMVLSTRGVATDAAALDELREAKTTTVRDSPAPSPAPAGSSAQPKFRTASETR